MDNKFMSKQHNIITHNEMGLSCNDKSWKVATHQKCNRISNKRCAELLMQNHHIINNPVARIKY